MPRNQLCPINHIQVICGLAVPVMQENTLSTLFYPHEIKRGYQEEALSTV